jgi:hypothetical protein
MSVYGLLVIRIFNFSVCLLCKTYSVICFALHSSTNKQNARVMVIWRVGEMHIAVPVAILVAAVTSLSAQLYYVWPNYQTDQKERSEQAGGGSSKDKAKQDGENSSKDKSGQGGESSSKDKSEQRGESSSKDTPTKSDKSASAAVAKGRQSPRAKRLE